MNKIKCARLNILIFFKIWSGLCNPAKDFTHDITEWNRLIFSKFLKEVTLSKPIVELVFYIFDNLIFKYGKNLWSLIDLLFPYCKTCSLKNWKPFHGRNKSTLTLCIVPPLSITANHQMIITSLFFLRTSITYFYKVLFTLFLEN